MEQSLLPSSSRSVAGSSDGCETTDPGANCVSPEQLKLAYVIASKYWRRLPRLKDDIESAALYGLVLAVRRYDGSVKFVTYAWKMIHGSVSDMLRNEAPLGYRRLRGRKVATVPQSVRLTDVHGYCDPEFSDTVERLCVKVPKRHATVLRLIYIEGLDVPQIAERLRKSRNRVWQMERQAYAMLRELLAS